MKVEFPYGKEKIKFDIPDSRLNAVLNAKLEDCAPKKDECALVEDALINPIDSPRLDELSRGKKNIVIIASDHTRPVPSKIIMPRLLREIRRGNPNANITILIATGCHRASTKDELSAKFGEGIVRNERIVMHDCDSAGNVFLGKLPSGGDLFINEIAVNADLLLSEGFIEPHFFAGFSGGAKSVLPGIAARKSVVYNHNAGFIDNAAARAGNLRGNPIQEDMIFAAKAARLAFICNVVINSEKKIVHAAAGGCQAAHKAGCEFLSGLCAVKSAPAKIVITSNGGYPLDQNIYQAVKGMSTAEACVEKDGVIIMLAKSNDGHGGEEFYNTFKNEKNIEKILAEFRITPKDETRVDQWQSQIFIRVLQKSKVIYISDAPDEMIINLNMIPAHSIAEALNTAETILKDKNASITAIPDGVSVILSA